MSMNPTSLCVILGQSCIGVTSYVKDHLTQENASKVSNSALVHHPQQSQQMVAVIIITIIIILITVSCGESS